VVKSKHGDEPEQEIRIALLTPYNGCNLGDAAIQDALMQNLRTRLPNVKFLGISLRCGNFEKTGGIKSFELCASERKFYSILRESKCGYRNKKCNLFQRQVVKYKEIILKSTSWPHYLIVILKMPYLIVRTCAREMHHCVNGYRLLRQQDLLIVSGGGQIDEEWGGAYGHPYALFKWSILSRLAGVPCAFSSVGSCKVRSRSARLFLSVALRLACYRSYRDSNSRAIASLLLHSGICDPVVPDLAFSISTMTQERNGRNHDTALDRKIIAISLIAYAKPGRWPSENQALYDRYLIQMASIVTHYLEGGKNLIFVCSSLGDDESVIPDLLELLNEKTKNRIPAQLCVQKVTTWQEFIASIRGVELLIASRLHSAILAAVCNIPIVAISFDSKVDWMMADLGMSEYVVPIQDFVAADVLEVMSRVQECRDRCSERLVLYLSNIQPICERQFDVLADIALGSSRA